MFDMLTVKSVLDGSLALKTVVVSAEELSLAIVLTERMGVAEKQRKKKMEKQRGDGTREKKKLRRISVL